MQAIIKERLAFVYGAAEAERLLPQVQALIERYRMARAFEPAARLGERDVLLITYADQVRAADESPLQALAGLLARRLDGVVSGVHLLPLYPSSSDDGFAVIDYYAVDPAFGDWDDVAQIGRRFDLMLDAVVNHVSAQSAWFRAFLAADPNYRDYFITVEGNPDLSAVVRPRTLPLLTVFQTANDASIGEGAQPCAPTGPGTRQVWTTFSADQVDLNYANPQTLLAVLDVLLFYAARGARFIRLDAIAYLWKTIGTTCIHLPQTHAIIQLMRAVLDEAAPQVLLITETNVPHADNVSYFGHGDDEAQRVYNFALPPLVLHAFQTGRADALARWAQGITLPSPRVTFFNFLASHDGIGLNPARGILSEDEVGKLAALALEHGGYVSYKQNADGSRSPYELNIAYFDALSNPAGSEPLEIQIARFLCAQAIMLAFIGMPGIYFHSLFGSRGDRAGAETSGIARRINRQKLELAELEQSLADAASLRAQVFTRYAELLRVRRAHSAFDPYGEQTVVETDARVFALLRGGRGERVLCLHNVSSERVNIVLPPVLLGMSRVDLVSGKMVDGANNALAVTLLPYQFMWLLARE